MQQKTILITGGAGFIGSALVRYIINNTKHTVVNFDKLTYAGNLYSLEEVANNEHYFFERGDICDEATLRNVFNKYNPDAVIHLAAESHVDRSIDSPDDFVQTNIVGTYNLLKTSYRYWSDLGIENKNNFRFHHVSTDEVYGDLGQADSTVLFTEKTAYEPSSPYSASKASSDHLVKAWQRTYGLPTLVTNCSNNYGPYQFPEKLIPHMIINALSGKELPIYGDGQQVRDWLYVEDHVEALYDVLIKGKVGQTYNIGGHNEVRNIEVVEMLCDLLDDLRPLSDDGLQTTYKDLITFVKDRPGHDLRYAIDASKIQQDLGWTPKQTFETGLRKTLLWYLDNEKWWNTVLNGEYKMKRIGEV